MIDRSTQITEIESVARIIGEATSDEKIMWAEAPSQLRMAMTSLVGLILAIVLSGLLIAWLVLAASHGGFFLFMLFGVPGFALVLILLLSPLMLYAKARNMFYAVTNRRVIVINDSRLGKFESFYPVEIIKLVRTPSFGGLGGIYMEAAITQQETKVISVVKIRFIGVRDPESAERAIVDLRQTASTE